MPVRLLQVTALAAFFCAFGVHAASLSKASTSLPYRTNGKTTTFGEGNQVARPNGTAPSGSGQIGQSGWHYGTGAEVNPATGQTMNLGANGEVYMTGMKYPVTASHSVPAKEVALAALGLVGGWPGLAIAGSLAAYPYIKDWFDKGGVRPADGGGLEIKGSDNRDFACDASRYYQPDVNRPPIGSTAPNGCGDFAPGTVFLEAKAVNKNATQCTVRNSCHESVVYGQWVSGRGLEDGWLPASMDDIAPYLMRTPFNPAMVSDVIQGGGTINLPQPNITGPTSIQGEPSTSTSTGTQTVNGQQVPTRTQTTSQTTYNFTTNNNQVTNTTNNTVTTTVTTNQSTGVVIGTTTTETETKPEEKDDRSECEKNPKQLNCADLDTPQGEIPRKQIDVSWSPVDLGLGGGSCPAPVQIYENKQFSYQSTCDNLHIIKPLVIAIALFVGGMILFGGRADQ